MTFVAGPVAVEVPATSANLGPGYDCLGLALDLHDRLVGEVHTGDLEVEVDGEGAGTIPCDERHLVLRSMTAAFTAMGLDRPALRLRCSNVIPHRRGLGSSSAAIVGGIVLARALVADGRDRLDDRTALGLAHRIEGHPDNVAPALVGGFVVTGHSGEEVWVARSPVADGIGTVAFVPPEGLSTEAARSLLPPTVDHRAAADNTGRAALLVAALAGAPELLWRATEDFLHQRFREPAMPGSVALVEALRARGVPAVISGAGPTVLAFTGPGLVGVEELRAATPRGWDCRPLTVESRGARVTDG